jgi:hypothetical protein
MAYFTIRDRAENTAKNIYYKACQRNKGFTIQHPDVIKILRDIHMRYNDEKKSLEILQKLPSKHPAIQRVINEMQMSMRIDYINVLSAICYIKPHNFHWLLYAVIHLNNDMRIILMKGVARGDYIAHDWNNGEAFEKLNSLTREELIYLTKIAGSVDGIPDTWKPLKRNIDWFSDF